MAGVINMKMVMNIILVKNKKEKKEGEKASMMDMTGWTFPMYRNGECTDYFVVSNRKNRTRKFVEKIIEEMGEEITELKISYISMYIEPANLTVRYCKSLGCYYDIYGEDFGGCGSMLNDGKTVLLKVD